WSLVLCAWSLVLGLAAQPLRCLSPATWVTPLSSDMGNTSGPRTKDQGPRTKDLLSALHLAVSPRRPEARLRGNCVLALDDCVRRGERRTGASGASRAPAVSRRTRAEGGGALDDRRARPRDVQRPRPHLAGRHRGRPRFARRAFRQAVVSVDAG